MEKETFHDKMQTQRENHFNKRKQAMDLIEQIPSYKDKQREIKKIAKSKFVYAVKSRKQQELERSLMAVRANLPENDGLQHQ